MAAGLPVVASRSGTVVETVVDGATGFLIEKNNVEQLAHWLSRGAVWLGFVSGLGVAVI